LTHAFAEQWMVIDNEDRMRAFFIHGSV
jgi:hypothetical protein